MLLSENAATGSGGKRPYNNIPFTNSGPVLAKLQSGSEDLARLLTAYNRDLFEAGLLQKPLVVTANKIESAIKKDGEQRVKALSKTVLKGNYLLLNLLNLPLNLSAVLYNFCRQTQRGVKLRNKLLSETE